MDLKRIAKAAFADYGIKVNQKDMRQVTLIERKRQDHFAHVRVFRVRTHDDKLYLIKQETVDANNKFSMYSARYITRFVIEI